MSKTSLDLLAIKNSPEKVQLARISHIYQKHPDLRSWEQFAADFGFVEAARVDSSIYYRGYGRDPYCIVASTSSSGKREFGGAAFVAKTSQDFDKAKLFPGATCTDLSQAPGGGRMVSIPTPTNNFIHVVWGQSERAPEPQPHHTSASDMKTIEQFNGSIQKRRYGDFRRFEPGPALVHKLGHYGYITKDFDKDVEFYTSNFNFVPSDILTSPRTDENMTGFFHLDLGEEYSDHHSLFLARAPYAFPETRLHHTSFEVNDFDSQLLGHDWLLSRNYKLVWGVGRHILGSQIFDYWKDPSGFIIEHYADGDLVNNKHRITREPDGGALSLSVWGPAFNERHFSGLSTLDLVTVLFKLAMWPFFYLKQTVMGQ